MSDAPSPQACRLREWAGAVRRRTVSDLRAGWLLKTAFAGAVVFALAALFVRTNGASGITLGEILAACDDAQNVHVTRVSPGTGEVVYEMWISSEMSFLAMTVGQKHVVYDLSARRRSHTDLTSGRMESSPLSDQEYAGVQQIAATCPGPFLMDAPSDAKWRRVPDEGDQAVYQSTRTNWNSAGQPYLVRFEVVIDRVARLPQMLRLFHNGPAATGWECISVTTFEYPAGAQMKSLMEQAGD